MVLIRSVAAQLLRAALPVLCACSGLLHGPAATPLHAQSVRSVSVVADLASSDGSAAVHVEIEFTSDDTAGVRIELLHFANTAADGFRAGSSDAPLTQFDTRTGSRAYVLVARAAFERIGIERAGLVPSPTPRAGAGSAGTLWRLDATYVVNNASITRGESVLAHIPVLTVALPPPRDAGNVFHAEVRVPSSWSVSEGFPAGLRPDDAGRYTVDLPVAPSVISVRARTDGAWRPGVPLLLDVAAGLILLAFLFIAWQRLDGRAAAGPGGVAPASGGPSPAITGDA